MPQPLATVLVQYWPLLLPLAWLGMSWLMIGICHLHCARIGTTRRCQTHRPY